MACPRLYKFQSYMVNHSEPGVATDVMVIPQYYWSNADIISEMEVTGTPVPLIYSEPLVSMPAVRSLLNSLPDDNVPYLDRRRQNEAGQNAWYPTNNTILLPVDEQPVFTQKLFDEVALSNRRLLRDRQNVVSMTLLGIE